MSKLIDVEKTLHAKNNGKKFPKFLVRLLKKIVHENEINEYMSKQTANGGIEFVYEAVEYLNVKIEVNGVENLEPEKKYIFASNHPLGGLDGLSLLQFLGKKYDGKVRFIANDILMNFKPLRDIAVPTNKHGVQGKDMPAKMNEMFESENQVMIFPAGACSRYQPPKGIYDLNWSKTFIVRSIQHQRDVVPVYFEGRNSRFFYALGYIRKILGVKLNIEMLFLSHEMFRNKHSKFKVFIGKPIPWQTFDKSKSPHKWAMEVKEIVYKMRK